MLPNPSETPPGAALAIEVRDLGRRYGRRWALAGLDLAVPWGAVWMVAGPNGAGKSTLLRLLATATRADRGEGRVAGYDLRRERLEVRRRVALLSHHSYAYSALSARENLEVVSRLLGKDAAAGRPSRLGLDELLAEVGLGGRGDEPVAHFSAGMRKRLALARVLLQRTPVVLLDEPYGELDPAGFLLVDEIIGRLRREGATVVLATHLLERGREICDRALLLVEGRQVWSGLPPEMTEMGEMSEVTEMPGGGIGARRPLRREASESRQASVPWRVR